MCAIACWYCSGCQPKFLPVIVPVTRSSGVANSPSKCRNVGPLCDCSDPTICIAFRGVLLIPLICLGIGLWPTKSAYVRLPTPFTSVNSVTKWQDRQLIASPANGPGTHPIGVFTSATTGSPVGKASFTPVIFSAKYSANRVSTKMRSPTFWSAGAPSASCKGSGAFPDPQPPLHAIATVTQTSTIFRNCPIRLVIPGLPFLLQIHVIDSVTA